MRLGAYVAELEPGSQVAEAYGKTVVSERHRHRYEFNPRYRSRFEAAGFRCSGTSPDGRLVEFIELDGPPVLGRHPGPPRVQEPAQPAGAAVPGVRRRRAGPGRGPRAAPVRASSVEPWRRAPASSSARGFRRAQLSVGWPGSGIWATRRSHAPSRHVVQGTFEAPDGDDLRARRRPPPSARGHGAAARRRTTVVLVRQYRARSTPSSSRSPPACGRRRRGRPSVTAHRELAEEVGKRAGRLELLAEFYNSPGISDELSHIFLATELSDVPHEPQGVEEEHMTIERRGARRRARPDRRRASSPTPRRSSACCWPGSARLAA